MTKNMLRDAIIIPAVAIGLSACNFNVPKKQFAYIDPVTQDTLYCSDSSLVSSAQKLADSYYQLNESIRRADSVQTEVLNEAYEYIKTANKILELRAKNDSISKVRDKEFNDYMASLAKKHEEHNSYMDSLNKEDKKREAHMDSLDNSLGQLEQGLGVKN